MPRWLEGSCMPPGGGYLDEEGHRRMGDRPIKRILVVDDEEACRSMSQLCIAGMGYLCEVAGSCEDALEKLGQAHFDLVISDIRMSGKDGVELMREALAIYPHLDFIIMTGFSVEYSYSDIVNAGATDYLGKPFEIAELKAKLERIEREKQVLKRLQETNNAHLWESQVNALVAELSKAILTEMPFEDISSLAIKRAKTLTNSSIGFMGYINPQDGSFVAGSQTAGGNNGGKGGKTPEFDDLNKLGHWLLENPEPIIVNNPNEAPENLGIHLGSGSVRRFLSAPAIAGGSLLGLVVLGDAEDDYTRKELMLVERLANFYAIAIQKSRSDQELRHSIDKLRTTMEEIIEAMALAVETRDPYTAGHQRRVVSLACAIAREMEIPSEQTEAVRLAGIIHDLGKIHIPAEILSKPGRLTEIEFAMMKTHPQASYNILKTIDFPWPIAEIVLQHHERINGSGYPKGLAGKDILLEARILAVADVVEAMSSHRPYRPALGMEAALDEISRNKGTLYDPTVVTACLELVQRKGFQFA
jgi:response regulator RpfG family c-di-GMP phosphodiesterase